MLQGLLFSARVVRSHSCIRGELHCTEKQREIAGCPLLLLRRVKVRRLPEVLRRGEGLHFL